MQTVKFVMIDDGVSSTAFFPPYANMSLKISEKGINDDRNTYAYSHGSICSAIFYKYLNNKDIEFISIKILDNKTHKGYLSDLISAIDWCIINKVNLVNISLGTKEKSDFKQLSEIIKKAVQSGIIFVAAMDNENLYSLPACLNGVIGVKTSPIYNDGSYKLRWYPFDGIEVITSGIHQLKSKDGTIHLTSNSNSFAAPVISAYVSDLIYKNHNISYIDILKQLEKKAKTIIGEYISGFYPYIWEIDDYEIRQVWDFYKYSNIVKKYLIESNLIIDIPIVCVTGSNGEMSINFINLFVQKLETLYTYNIISDFSYDIKENYIIFPFDFDKYKFCMNVINKHRCDILILHSNDLTNVDYCIDINDYIKVKYKDETKKLIEIRNELARLQDCVNYLYNLLIS